MLSATTIRTTCPRDCYDACGVLVKTSADGTINVVGDPDHDVSRGFPPEQRAGRSSP